jgi:hypothetical protein
MTAFLTCCMCSQPWCRTFRTKKLIFQCPYYYIIICANQTDMFRILSRTTRQMMPMKITRVVKLLAFLLLVIFLDAGEGYNVQSPKSEKIKLIEEYCELSDDMDDIMVILRTKITDTYTYEQTCQSVENVTCHLEINYAMKNKLAQLLVEYDDLPEQIRNYRYKIGAHIYDEYASKLVTDEENCYNIEVSLRHEIQMMIYALERKHMQLLRKTEDRNKKKIREELLTKIASSWFMRA